MPGQPALDQEKALIPLYDNIRSRTTPVVTKALILANAVVFLHEISLARIPLQHFIIRHSLVPVTLTNPELRMSLAPQVYLTMLSFMFLHGGWLHILSNMWYLRIFGNSVEDRLGHVRFLLFYLLCGVLSGLVEVAAAPGSQVPLIGASGAVAGVLGAYIVCFPRARIKTIVPIFFLITFLDLPAVFLLGMWFFMQLFNGYLRLSAPMQTGGVAYWAHVGGFVAGILLVAVLAPSRRIPRPDDDEDEESVVY